MGNIVNPVLSEFLIQESDFRITSEKPGFTTDRLWAESSEVSTDFWNTPVKSGFNTVRLTLWFTGIYSELNLGQLCTSYVSLF